MHQSAPTSSLDSPVPSDKVRFDYPVNAERISSFENPADSPVVAEELKRALALATAKDISTSTVEAMDTISLNKEYEIPKVSIEGLIKASEVLKEARQYELAA